ncbi:MAG: pyruvate kinase [Anaerolineae bacterium]|nr:pyruvate kinase [Anaerolineae bacterium]
MARFTKIIATIGPSCRDEKQLAKLIEADIDVARLNFSHGSHEDHLQAINTIRSLSKRYNKPITILQDLQGPKMRVGRLPEEGIKLQAGQVIVLTNTEEIETPAEIESGSIPFEVPRLGDSLKKGDHILLDDGQLELEVLEVNKQRIRAEVVLGGTLYSHKGVNLPGVPLNIPCLTDKDKEDLTFGLQQGVDVVALSFVRQPEDILSVREQIAQLSPQSTNVPIIAKLERPEAVQNLDQIIKMSDGVMVARGDLAVETRPAVVPIIQKEIIRTAYYHAKPVITATQMLDSMIHNPRPTRAEASDVANAIFDGTDAVMLSGETASGKYPVESVSMMNALVIEAEQHIHEWGHCQRFEEYTNQDDDAVSITRAARELAHDRNVVAITVFTESGRTALLMSKARPRVPIMAFTPNVKTFQRLGMYWGVTPFLVPYASTVEDMLSIIEQEALASSKVKAGQQVILISGLPVGAMRPPNLALLHTIGEGKSVKR